MSHSSLGSETEICCIPLGTSNSDLIPFIPPSGPLGTSCLTPSLETPPSLTALSSQHPYSIIYPLALSPDWLFPLQTSLYLKCPFKQHFRFLLTMHPLSSS